MKSSLYIGTIHHERFIPKNHEFKYPIFMYFLDLEKISFLPSLGRWFSVSKWALNRFRRSDYMGNSRESLYKTVSRKMHELTGHQVKGKVFGLLNLRTLGLYFSPVNFYFGFDEKSNFTHFLAEVSNIPWNERHYYCHHVADNNLNPIHDKTFKVSPFNPVEQKYQWKISKPGKNIKLQLSVLDERGHVFSANLHLNRNPLNKKILKNQILKKPAMAIFIVMGIYYQAFKLYLKGVPYIPYTRRVT